MLKFTEITELELDEFALTHPLGNIHQTSAWADFQSKAKNRGKCVLCGVKEGDKLRACGVFIRQKLLMGMCWYFTPRGPLFSSGEDFLALMDGFERKAKKENCVFVRVEWDTEHVPYGRKAHAHYFPQDTIMVSLEGDILKQMKPKGRYNIKVAEKHGVKVRKSDDAGEFFKLFQETTNRDGFQGHDQEYYQNMLDSLGDKAQLYLADYEGEIVAGIIVTFYQDTAIYYFGASSDKHREVMSPYLLQWEAMRDAQERGCKLYDLFGVAPEVERRMNTEELKNGVSLNSETTIDTKHPWAGITKFKEKFGGERFPYAEAREKVLKPFWYWVIRIVKRLRVKDR